MGAAFSELLRAITSICQDSTLHSQCCTPTEGCLFDFDGAPAQAAREHDLSLETACCTLTLHDGEPPLHDDEPLEIDLN